MLVLTRRPQEGVCIFGSGVVCPVEVRGDKVRVGVVAQEDIKVFRVEIMPHALRDAFQAVREVPLLRDALGRCLQTFETADPEDPSYLDQLAAAIADPYVEYVLNVMPRKRYEGGGAEDE